MVEKIVSLCKPTQTSPTQGMWPQTEHPWTKVEGCQAWALFEGLTHPPSLRSRPPPLLRDAPTAVSRLVLVVALLS